MTVADLIKLLQAQPQDAEAVLMSSEVSSSDVCGVRFNEQHIARGDKETRVYRWVEIY